MEGEISEHINKVFSEDNYFGWKVVFAIHENGGYIKKDGLQDKFDYDIDSKLAFLIESDVIGFEDFYYISNQNLLDGIPSLYDELQTIGNYKEFHELFMRNIKEIIATTTAEELIQGNLENIQTRKDLA